MAFEIGGGGANDPSKQGQWLEQIKQAVEKLRGENQPGYYEANPINVSDVVVEQPEEVVEETPVVEATETPKVEETVTETPNPLAEAETQTEEKKETETSTPEIVSQDANQRNEGFISNVTGIRGASKESTDWVKKKGDGIFSDSSDDDDNNAPTASAEDIQRLTDISKTAYESALKKAEDTRFENEYLPAQYGTDPEEAKQLWNQVGNIFKGIGNWFNTNILNNVPTEPYEYYDKKLGVTYKVVPNENGSFDVYELADKDKNGKTVFNFETHELETTEPQFIFTGRYDGKGNPVTITPSQNAREDADNPINISPDNPYTDPAWQQAYEVGLLRGNPIGAVTTDKTGTFFGQATATTNAATADNPISDVRVGDKTVHYMDSEGNIHSVPLTTANGQAVVDRLDSEYVFDINPSNVKVDDSYVGYFDENGNYRTVDLSSGRGQQIEGYVDEIKDDYPTIEAAYAKAIEMVNDDYADTNYSPNGTQGGPVYASIMSDSVPTMTGYENEEEINYQDYLLQNFVVSGYNNKANAGGEEWELVIPEGCEGIIASDKEHANDPKRNDDIETVYMTDEEYVEKVNKFIEANPQLAALLDSGKVTPDAIIANFLKAPRTTYGGSSYRSGGYGGYYRGGGGGGYRSGGGSSGGSSNSAGSTTQNQQRVYNIMKNWSF
jgi:soluble cytochrome b562